jgi:O-antigen ligase
MAGLSIAAPFDRARLAQVADALVVLIAVALPWSTSALGVLLVLWLLALIPTLDWPDVRRELFSPAGGLPVLLVLVGIAGMAWADVSWLARWKGLDGLVKLLLLPLLLTQFRRSDNGRHVFTGFLIACLALLIASWTVALWPNLPKGSSDYGVFVKSYITQSVEFTICAAGLLYLAVEAARAKRWPKFALTLVLALAFLQDIFFVATARTTLVVIPVLLVLYGAWRFGAKGLAGALIVTLVAAAGVWASSPYVRMRVDQTFTATERHTNLRHVTSSEERMVFWTKSLRFIASAPLIGHGTGSIPELFKHSAVGQVGASSEVSTNPHNQTFAVAIQLGFAGVVVLWAMWLAHLLVFRGGGFTAWLGLVLVTQNVVGSLFNSFLFDYTEGWLYVVGVGVAAGMVLRGRDQARAPEAAAVG